MATTFSAANRVNALPTSDVLRLRKDDVDCSGSDFASIPEDGQFVSAPGATAANCCTGNAVDVKKRDETTDGGKFANVDALDDLAGAQAAAGLAMVYSGGAGRSDLSGLGYTRIPVARGAWRFSTKLFNADGAPSSIYKPGQYVTVDACVAAVQGDKNRLVITPCDPAKASWAVGRVASILDDSTVSGVGTLEIEMFERPIIYNPANVAA